MCIRDRCIKRRAELFLLKLLKHIMLRSTSPFAARKRPKAIFISKVKAQEKTRVRFVKRKNEILRCRGAVTCLLTRRGEVSEGRDAGAVGRSSFCIKGTEEKKPCAHAPRGLRRDPVSSLLYKKGGRKGPPRRATRRARGELCKEQVKAPAVVKLYRQEGFLMGKQIEISWGPLPLL